MTTAPTRHFALNLPIQGEIPVVYSMALEKKTFQIHMQERRIADKKGKYRKTIFASATVMGLTS